MATPQSEKDIDVVRGYVVDSSCLRHYSQKDMHELPQNHTANCALMGHCIESGYGLVDKGGKLILLDSEATPKIVQLLYERSDEKRIDLQVTRKRENGHMKTTDVEVVSANKSRIKKGI